nr:MAG TPA: hypothetical protein [Caudoviricetes sp.]
MFKPQTAGRYGRMFASIVLAGLLSRTIFF